MNKSKKIWKFAVSALAIMGLMVGPMQWNSAQAHSESEVIADLAERLLDAVVNISISQKVSTNRSNRIPQLPDDAPFKDFFEDFFKDREDNGENEDNGPMRRSESLGSGFVLDGEKGIVITNNHVIAEADEITVTFNDGTSLEAEVIGKDKETDIAVLKVESGKTLMSVDFGDSSIMRVGESVIAIGNPFGLGGSVTSGIISAQNRDISLGRYDNYIQTDASINKGNSGGPLFNMRGEVIGINTLIYSRTGGSVGVGFAIASETAKPVIEQLLEYGETRRGWLGVRIQQVTDEIAEGLGMEEAIGALVAGVDEKGPSKKAGIELGDVIIKFDGQDVLSMRELPPMVANTEVGKSVEVQLLRKGEEVTLNVELGRLKENDELDETILTEDEESGEETKEVIGLTLSTITETLRNEHKIDSEVNGVLITEVDPESAAAEKRISKGDVIVEVGQVTVETPSDVASQVESLKEKERNAALLLLSNSKGDVRFVAVRLEE